MDKQQTIAFIEGQLATGKISKEDLANLAGSVQASQPQFHLFLLIQYQLKRRTREISLTPFMVSAQSLPLSALVF